MAKSAPLRTGIRRQFFLQSTVMLVVEAALLVWPLWTLLSRSSSGDSLWESAVIGFAALSMCWALALFFWLRPAWRVVSGTGGDPSRAYQGIFAVPLRVGILRTALWVALGTWLGYQSTGAVGFTSREVAEYVALSFVLAGTASALRAWWLSLLGEKLLARCFSDVPELRRFADGYATSLALIGASVVGVTTAAILAFTFFFLPISVESFLRLAALSPLALGGAILFVHVCGRRFQSDMDGYLYDQLESQSGQTKKEADGQAARIYRQTQLIPYQLSAIHVLVWLAVGVFAVLGLRSQLRFDSDDATLMLGIVVAISIGSSIYLALWYREALRPVRTHLTLRHPLPEKRPRGAFSLRAKLLLSFGGMMLFACGMALFWGFMQYKNLVTRFNDKQAELGLAWLESEVEAAGAARTDAPDGALVREVLKRVTQESSESGAVYYFRDTAGALHSFGGGQMGAPPLPWYASAKLTVENRGGLELRGHGLFGRHELLSVRWKGAVHPLGSLAVAYPNYRGRGAVVRPLKELLFFFLVLFGSCAGIVLLTVSQFVKPIRRLEERAEGMARGELGMPVSSEGEGDEIGRLTFALEQMRRALREKIRTTEEVNLDLERAVQTRTADLARKNRELAEALSKLTLAQDQLVRSEKMASIGQLVAGIAHEINNPVNAIVNTVGPLEEAISDVREGDDSTRSGALDDLSQMSKVVRRGAERTKAIVQALHNYSRTDDESVVDVDINRSVDDSLELLRHVLKEHVEVVREFGEVGRLRGHAGQLGQVFMNLLTNAAQAVSGQGDGKLTVRTELIGERIAITIVDNGPGIPEDILPRIFDPFFTTKDVGEGTGLGLSIVHGIVERHGGTIDVKSEAGQGTEFVIVLPRA